MGVACGDRDPLIFDIFDALIDLVNTRAFYQLIPQIYGDEVLTAEADFQWIQDML